MPTVAQIISAVSPLNIETVSVAGLGTTGEELRGASGKLHAVFLDNTAAAQLVYVKLYDKASAPDPASDIPFVILPVEAGQSYSVCEAIAGAAFSNGLWARCVTGKASTDATSPATSPTLLFSVGS